MAKGNKNSKGKKFNDSRNDELDEIKNKGKGGKSRPNKRWSKDERKPGHNDVSWYTPDPQLLADAGRWPYSRPVGTPLSRESILHLTDAVDNAVPGLCVAQTMITLGNSQNGNSALNVAANAVYTYVRHVNSGSRNYDAPDLMLYIGAIDSIYAYVTWLTRAYATIAMYADMNKYLPNDLGYVQSLDLDDIRENMANWRAKFNALLLKIGTLVVPDNFPIFRRHAWLFQNYYTEGPSIKDQMYFHTLMNVYKFQFDSSGAGMLKYVNILDYANPNTGLLGAAETLKLLDDLITPIFNNEDFNIMSGDILKAYDGKIMKLMIIPDLAIAMPINNVVFLEQFKNLRCIGGVIPTAAGTFDVTQDANKEYLIVDQNDIPIGYDKGLGTILPSMDSTQPERVAAMLDQWSRKIILSTELSDVTPEVNMLNTRCVSMPEIVYDASSPTNLSVNDFTMGSEVVGRVIFVSHDKNWQRIVVGLSSVYTYDATNITDVSDVNRRIQMLSSFRFHPAFDLIGVDVSTSPATYTEAGLPLFGIDNYTTIDFDHVKTLNDVAILGEFNVPRLAVLK